MVNGIAQTLLKSDFATNFDYNYNSGIFMLMIMYPLQTKELASLLQVSPRLIVEWAQNGLLPSIKHNVGRGSSRLYTSDAADRARLLCRLKGAGIGVRDMRKLLPLIEQALRDEAILSMPYPILLGKRLYTLCRLSRQGPVLIDGTPPGQTVIPLMILDELSQEDRAKIGLDK